MARALAFPEHVCFTCLECGDCCRSWDVPVSVEERDRLAGLDWKGREADLVERSPSGDPPDDGPSLRLARRPDGACIYLGADQRCRIHTHFGASAKPIACQLFPFSVHPVGDRVAVDVSFACRSVSRGDGRPIGSTVRQWGPLADACAIRDDGRHYLRPGVTIDGPRLEELEAHLLGFVRDGRLALFERVRCLHQYARLATTGDPTLPTARVLREAIATGLPGQIRGVRNEASLDKTQRAVFYQWLHLALNPTDGDGDAAGRAAREQAGTRFRDQRGRPTVAGRELSVEFGGIATIDTSFLVNGECRPLRDFLEAKIIGQKFLLAGGKELPFVEAVPKFLLAVPMVVWAAKALAAERSVAAVEERDVRDAIRLIDRTLGQVPTSALPDKLQKVYDWVMCETDLVEAALSDVLTG